MNIPETYDYLVRARRDLWATLAGVPDAWKSQERNIGFWDFWGASRRRGALLNENSVPD
jgi:hypothetical protein